MAKKTSNQKKTKKKWAPPRLEIVSEKKYESQKQTKIYAQYTGGGGTGTHNSTDVWAESVYNDCM